MHHYMNILYQGVYIHCICECHVWLQFNSDTHEHNY